MPRYKVRVTEVERTTRTWEVTARNPEEAGHILKHGYLREEHPDAGEKLLDTWYDTQYEVDECVEVGPGAEGVTGGT